MADRILSLLSRMVVLMTSYLMLSKTKKPIFLRLYFHMFRVLIILFGCMFLFIVERIHQVLSF